MQPRADGEGAERARAGTAERDRARRDGLGERIGLRLDAGQSWALECGSGCGSDAAAASNMNMNPLRFLTSRDARRRPAHPAPGPDRRGERRQLPRYHPSCVLPAPAGGAHLSVVRSVGTTHLGLLVARGDVLRPAAPGRVPGVSASPGLPPSPGRLRGVRPYSSPSSRGTIRLHDACRTVEVVLCDCARQSADRSAVLAAVSASDGTDARAARAESGRFPPTRARRIDSSHDSHRHTFGHIRTLGIIEIPRGNEDALL